MSDFSMCSKGKDCVNPRQGKLNYNDYGRRSSSSTGKMRMCKECCNAKQRRNRAKRRSYTTCAYGKYCVNERQGNLTVDDFYPITRHGKVCRTYKCIKCIEVYGYNGQRFDKHEEKVWNTWDSYSLAKSG